MQVMHGGMSMTMLLLCFILLLVGGNAFIVNRNSKGGFRTSISAAKGPRPIHKEFTVEKATPEKLDLLQVSSWPRWSTNGSEKYKVGIKSPLKVYDTNELSYIISGKMEITPVDPPGQPVLVQAGDFVTFPDGFACHWFVIETVVKNWYLY